MISTVCWAALPLRSTQNTCAPWRAKVTAVALPLPQPGPIEPAPTTIAVLPLSRCIAFSRSCFAEIIVARTEPLRNPGCCVASCCFPGLRGVYPWARRRRDPRASSGLRIARTHRRGVDTNRMRKNLRQRPAFSTAAQSPFAGGAGIAEHHLRHRRAGRSPLKPAVDQPRLRRRLHAGARSLDAGLHQFEPLRRDAPVFLPVDLLDRVGPHQRERRDRQRLDDAGGCQAKAQAVAVAARRRHCHSTIIAVTMNPAASLKRKSPSRQSAPMKATIRSASVSRVNRKPIATRPNRPMAISALNVANATAPEKPSCASKGSPACSISAGEYTKMNGMT